MKYSKVKRRLVIIPFITLDRINYKILDARRLLCNRIKESKIKPMLLSSLINDFKSSWKLHRYGTQISPTCHPITLKGKVAKSIIEKGLTIILYSDS